MSQSESTETSSKSSIVTTIRPSETPLEAHQRAAHEATEEIGIVLRRNAFNDFQYYRYAGDSIWTAHRPAIAKTESVDTDELVNRFASYQIEEGGIIPVSMMPKFGSASFNARQEFRVESTNSDSLANTLTR